MAEAGTSARQRDGDLAIEVLPLTALTPLARTSQSVRICPLQYRVFKQKYGDLIRHFIDLEALRPERDHSTCLEAERCRAYDSADRQHRPKHLCASGDCAEQLISEDELIPILQRGDLPVLYFTKIPAHVDSSALEAQQPILRVRKMEKADKYVAISHVWFDGLGNSERNALPTCQLQRLRTSLTSLLRGWSTQSGKAYEIVSARQIQILNRH